MMLHNFIHRERLNILAMADEIAIEMGGLRRPNGGLEEGWGPFLDEIIAYLRDDQPFGSHAIQGLHTELAARFGVTYWRLGYTISEVVHGYGSICQAVTQLATLREFKISPREFQKLNLSLDTAIADAVAAFERNQTDTATRAEQQRLGTLAHELRNALQSATVALEMIENGIVGTQGSTGRILRESLKRMTSLIDGALTSFRLHSEPEWRPVRVLVGEVLGEISATSYFVARARNIHLQLPEIAEVEVEVDRQLLVSAISNLVQNAIKFSIEGGSVTIRCKSQAGRVLIEIEDSCGGLPTTTPEELFNDGVQRSGDKSGLGLGLSISRDAIRRNRGEIRLKDLPGVGCIFTIDLPLARPTASALALDVGTGQ